MSQKILKKYNILAKKSLGQNFLVNEDIGTEISNLIHIEGKKIIEVGPGYGALTEKLLTQEPNALHLVELDNDMVEILEDRVYTGDLNIGEDIEFKIYKQDVLEFVPMFKSYDIIANIPYYITSPILRHFLYDIKNIPDKMVILMQKDVGDKILGGKKEKSSVISLMVQKKCIVTEEIFVGKENFTPKPKIESSVLLFKAHKDFSEIDDIKFLEFIKIGFQNPRKKLIKNLASGGYDMSIIREYFSRQGYDENLRGEDLNISQWCSLFLNLHHK